MDQLETAFDLVVGDLEELAVLVERDRDLRDQQRTGEAVFSSSRTS
jgi:hypothetical protein